MMSQSRDAVTRMLAPTPTYLLPITRVGEEGSHPYLHERESSLHLLYWLSPCLAADVCKCIGRVANSARRAAASPEMRAANSAEEHPEHRASSVPGLLPAGPRLERRRSDGGDDDQLRGRRGGALQVRNLAADSMSMSSVTEARGPVKPVTTLPERYPVVTVYAAVA